MDNEVTGNSNLMLYVYFYWLSTDTIGKMMPNIGTTFGVHRKYWNSSAYQQELENTFIKHVLLIIQNLWNK